MSTQEQDNSVELSVTTNTQVVEETASEELISGADIAAEQRKKMTSTLADMTNTRQIEVELKRGYRVIDSPTYGKLRIYLPTIEVEYQADLVYSEEVLRLMTETELKTSEDLFAVLAEKGTWTEEHNQKMESLKEETFDLTADLAVAQSELIKKPNSKQHKRRVDKIQAQVDKVRKDYLKMVNTHSKYFGYTVEGKAQEKQLVYKLIHCVKYDENNTPVWETMKDLEEGHSNRVRDIVIQFTTFVNGIAPQVLDLVPELKEEFRDEDDSDTSQDNPTGN